MSSDIDKVVFTSVQIILLSTLIDKMGNDKRQQFVLLTTLFHFPYLD